MSAVLPLSENPQFTHDLDWHRVACLMLLSRELDRIEEHLTALGVKVSRLARGLPTGGAIEFANVEILREALAGRRAPSDDGGKTQTRRWQDICVV